MASINPQSALETAKNSRENAGTSDSRENILVNRKFLSGHQNAQLCTAKKDLKPSIASC